jgi:predicted signal transduction protein with EAL and GGDEF domain
MNKTEIKSAMREIGESLIDSDEGCTASRIMDAFAGSFDVDDDFTESILHDWLFTQAREAHNNLKAKISNAQGELTFPGMPRYEATVTTRSDTGEYSLKNVDRATAKDLIEDLEIHRENVAAASAKLNMAEERNEYFLLLMDLYDVDTVADVIRCLAGPA